MLTLRAQWISIYLLDKISLYAWCIDWDKKDFLSGHAWPPRYPYLDHLPHTPIQQNILLLGWSKDIFYPFKRDELFIRGIQSTNTISRIHRFILMDIFLPFPSPIFAFKDDSFPLGEEPFSTSLPFENFLRGMFWQEIKSSTSFDSYK